MWPPSVKGRRKARGQLVPLLMGGGTAASTGHTDHREAEARRKIKFKMNSRSKVNRASI